jgi:hypothetical protein
VINEKISNFDVYSCIRHFEPRQKDAILGALDASLKEEDQRLERLIESDWVIPTGKDIDQFVRAARRYGYIDRVERHLLDEIVDKIYITRKMNDTNYQQDRITVKYKYIGVLTGIYKPRSMGELKNLDYDEESASE